jgi:hypothetical protein
MQSAHAALLLQYGAQGLLGLGFTMPGVGINRALAAAQSAERVLATNPFLALLSQEPALPPFFTVSLGRADDALEGPIGGDGMLTIGAYAPGMERLARAPRLRRVVPRGEQFEQKPRWTTALGALVVNGRRVSVHSAFADVDDGALALFDTGTTLSAIPPHLAEEIYGAVDGAFVVQDLRGRGRKDWVVPCDAVVDLAVEFGCVCMIRELQCHALGLTTACSGQEFPVHPLDLSRTRIVGGEGEDPRVVCTGVWEPSDGLAEHGVDMILGGSFLLNTHASCVLPSSSRLPFH